jgi:hypothetical protein
LERFNSKSILNLRKKKSAKSVIFLKNPEWARLCILIVIFSSNIGLWWNWWRWKAKNKCKKYVRNKFFLIRTFTIPKRPDNKESQICTNLESFSYLDWNFKKNEKICTYSIWTRRPIYDFSRISRVSSASLILINRPLTFEEKTHKLWGSIRSYFKKDFCFSFFVYLFSVCI